MFENFLIILAFNWFAVTILWFSTLKIKRADFIDIYWGPGFFLSALLIFFLHQNFTLANYIILILVGAWGFRLALYLFSRNIKKNDSYISNYNYIFPCKYFRCIFIRESNKA